MSAEAEGLQAQECVCSGLACLSTVMVSDFKRNDKIEKTDLKDVCIFQKRQVFTHFTPKRQNLHMRYIKKRHVLKQNFFVSSDFTENLNNVSYFFGKKFTTCQI